MEKKCCQKCLRASRDGDDGREVACRWSVITRLLRPRPHPKCCSRFASVIDIALASGAGFAPVAASVLTADDVCTIA